MVPVILLILTPTMPDIFTPHQTKQREKPAPEIAKEEHGKNATQKGPGIFTAYQLQPKGISFANQEPDENILLFLRRHFATNFPWVSSTLLFLIAPIPLGLLLGLSGVAFDVIPTQVIFVLVLFYYIMVLNFAFVKFITWFYHVGVVTQKRLLDLDIDNILHYHLSETNIQDIVDVSHSQKGFFQGFFNYGNVPMQTEAIKANFEFEASPNPATVADIITDLRREKKGKKPDA